MPRTILVCAVALLALSACIPPEPDDDVMRTFDPEETVMGEIQERGVLIVGVENDVPPLSVTEDCREGDLGMPECEATGFAVDLAREVADSLGVELVVAGSATSFLVGAPARNDVDIAFPFLPITQERIEDVERGMTDPYLVAHERLLVRDGSEIQQAGDLTSERVCQAIDEETGVPLESLVGFATPVAGSIGDCERMFRAGEVDVVVGPDIALAPIAESFGGRVVGDELNTEGYAAVTEPGASAWVDYVNAVIEEAQQEGRWGDYFAAYIEPGLGESQDPPGMSLEEAAALFPKFFSHLPRMVSKK